MNRKGICQYIDRRYPRLDYTLRELLIQMADEAEQAKPVRHTTEYEKRLAESAGRFLTLLFDRSYEVNPVKLEVVK